MFAARFLVLAVCLTAVCLFAAVRPSSAQDNDFPKSFRDIPGITREEVQAIEKALAGRKSFSYGALESTECFYRDDGSLDGYMASLAGLMSDFFGVPFEVKVYNWNDLRRGVRSGEIDFSSDFDPDNSSHAQALIMGRPFRERSIKFVSLADDASFFEADFYGSPRVAFMRDSIAETLAVPHLRKQYGNRLIIVRVDDLANVADMLRRREVDLFVADDAWTENFIGNPDIVVDTFRPLLYKRVAITTSNPEFAPIIGALSRAFPPRNLRRLHMMHHEGKMRFFHKIFVDSLNEAERSYYENRIRASVPVPVGASSTNYPVEFYDENEKRWSGIGIEILAEISEITGLKFRTVEFARDNWPLLLKMLRNGDPDAPMVLDMAYNENRARDFLLADKPYLSDHYALVSSANLRDLRHDEVLYHRVGLLQDSAYADVFQQWFPSHTNTIYFSSQSEEFKALEEGRIDLMMLSQMHFSYVTNFLRRTDFDINLVFEDPQRTGFGFGKGQSELRGIISKAQALVDTQSIVRRWEYSIFDYRSEDAQTRAILLGSTSIFMLLVIMLLILLLAQRRREGNRLRTLVAERTNELAEQVKATQFASEAKSRFLAGMSHDMRTPLNAIVGLSKLALTDDKGGDKSRNIQNIHNAGLTLLSLVNDLLDISKIEAGRYELSPVNYETPSLIDDTITVNSVRLTGKPVAFRLNLDETLPLRIYGDDLRVRQIFTNLLSNAFKYTERGKVEWTLSWKRDGDFVWLISSVRDTGIGIRPENLQKIFSDYNQIDVNAVRKTESTGLGLSIAWNLAKLMNGELTVESEYGKGSVFSARIRQGFIDDEPIGAELARKLRQFQYFAAQAPSEARIVYRDLSHAAALVVDDVESNLEVAAGMMRRYRMRVDCALGGWQAVDMVRAEHVRYDIIFMDHMMPDMDGIASLRAIRAIGGEYAGSVPVVALTANVIAGNEQRFLESGFQALLAKPLDMRQLDAVLSRFLHGWEKAAPIAQTENADGRRADTKDAPPPLLPLLQNANVFGLDVRDALKRFAGDAQAYWLALEAYARQMPALLEKAREVSGEKLADYIVVMHGIRGGSLGVGAALVGEKAAELEEAARKGNIAFVLTRNAECRETAERLLMDLSALLAKGGRAEKPLREAPDAETLARLKAACVAYDMDGVDAAMAELEACRYRIRQDLVVWLREQARAMEFARMVEALAKSENGR
ncbi:MAG: transporter substrate-binding domain-containing protein [Zoogloeaceae bacterium]|jgi:signal transduction histidine kinase/CheY-like chemotaxis protein|nr:transporter substrate-binding domain-containing protein [Zoogloeaceae bacterium]